MKKFLKNTIWKPIKFPLGIVFSALLIILSIVTTVTVLYHLLPGVDQPLIHMLGVDTTIEGLVASFFGDDPTVIFWIMVGCVFAFLVVKILQILLTRRWNSLVRNAIVLVSMWSICITAFLLSFSIFFIVDPLESLKEIRIPSKIGLTAVIMILFIYHVVSKKVTTKINRKLQSHDVAKETGAPGRTPIIWTTILRAYQTFFPEIILFIIVILLTSWNVSLYFIIILASCLFPVLAVLECDINIRAEARRKKREEHKKMVKDVSRNVSSNLL